MVEALQLVLKFLRVKLTVVELLAFFLMVSFSEDLEMMSKQNDEKQVVSDDMKRNGSSLWLCQVLACGLVPI